MIKERYMLVDKLRLSELFEEKARRFLKGARYALSYEALLGRPIRARDRKGSHRRCRGLS